MGMPAAWTGAVKTSIESILQPPFHEKSVTCAVALKKMGMVNKTKGKLPLVKA